MVYSATLFWSNATRSALEGVVNWGFGEDVYYMWRQLPCKFWWFDAHSRGPR